MKKFISLLGSTGSVGLSSLDIIQKKKIILSHLFFQPIKTIKLYAIRLKNLNQYILLLMMIKFLKKYL